MAVTPQKIGLLGGSFDPVHTAHIALAETAYRTLGLHAVQLIPAGDPWQRAPLKASPEHRLNMLRLACEQRTWLHINTIEIERSGPTYTIDTLEALPGEHEYYWILGADQLNNFCTWKSWRDIPRFAHLVVANRPDSPDTVPELLNEHLQAIHKVVFRLPFSPQDISATEIRERLALGLPADEFLSPHVAAYIRQHRLYKGDAEPKLTV